ncbi:hypothetical protein TMES_07355 [Thalassospira mesophila]|uniref:O-antigen ligase-related domain-containing protein n=1 Tax=Thalassospira mesophila TaxID=1293891 RepID=A0A1Y2L367_9PROT|nr:hypothetical protein TMES_07355 [Thalassospira mesophila]
MGQQRAGILQLFIAILGMAVIAVSLWALPLGGTITKILLILWALAGLLGRLGRKALGLDAALALLVWGAISLWVLVGSADMGAAIRLVGNLAVLPLGLAVGMMVGRRCLWPVMVPLLIYVLIDSEFLLTSEGWRLNNPFLFLALFVMAVAWRVKPDVSGETGNAGFLSLALAVIAAGGIFASQTRIAVLAMAVVMAARIRFTHAWTWLLGLPLAGLALWAVMDALPRLLFTHASGRLAYWQMFWQQWWQGTAQNRWLGFGAGAIERQLQHLQTASSFGALHNDHFHMLYESGIVGAALWLTGWGVMMWLVRASKSAVYILLAVMVTMITDNTLSYGHYLLCSGLGAGVAWHVQMQADDGEF